MNTSNFPTDSSITWRPFGQKAVLISWIIAPSPRYLFSLANSLIDTASDLIQEAIPGKKDLTVIFRHTAKPQVVLDLIADHKSRSPRDSVCYRLPLIFENKLESISSTDWIMLKNEMLSRQFSIEMLGFLPGFIYCKSDLSVSLPRRKVPHVRVAPGSVAVISEQLGIYAIESPAGWNIVGRTTIIIQASDFITGAILPEDQVEFYEMIDETTSQSLRSCLKK